MTNRTLADRYAGIPVGVLSDVLTRAGRPHQVLRHSFLPLAGLAGFAGPAFCVRGERKSGRQGPDLRFEMYRRIRAGSILVLASNGFGPGAVLGENMVTALRQGGCRGIVLDGGFRDRLGISEMGMPVRAMFVTPVASGGQFDIAELDAQVNLPGQSAEDVTIFPGDMVVGDEDGVIVIPAAGSQTVLEDAETVIEAEARTRAMILEGEDAERAYQAHDRFGHVRPVP